MGEGVAGMKYGLDVSTAGEYAADHPKHKRVVDGEEVKWKAIQLLNRL